jgi:DNA segregation ATPase FtsK/SpoIIIE, S-DNA-T family
VNEHTHEHDDLAPVHYLPAPATNPAAEVSTGRAVEPVGGPASEPLEGELVTDEEYRRLTSQKELALERYRGYRRDVIAVYKGVRTAVTHRRTRTVARHVVGYPVAGIGVVSKRWRDARGGNRFERLLHAAEAAGDEERLRYWQEAKEAARQRRHERSMDRAKLPGQWVKAGALGLVGVAGFLLVIGVIMAINTGDLADVLGPVIAVMDAVAFAVWFLTAYGVFLLAGATVLGIAYLYQQGRDHAEVPKWLAPTIPETAGRGGDVMDQLPDENTIVNALRNLNIKGFNDALKAGWRLRWRELPHVDGKGWRAQVDLPPACPVEEIVKRKNMLAHNLVRYPIEVWPTEPSPSVLDLWVAKPGALSGPVDPWPVLADLDHACIDYFAGVPVGVTIKGDVVRGRLSEANYVVGGIMGSGKSSLVITLVLGATLDVLVDVDVVVMAENSDYEPMRPRLRSLTTGAGDETVEACMRLLRQLYDELSLRGQALREHDARQVTRDLAAKDARLRPRIVVIDECQNLFLGEHGKAATEVVAKLMSTARKYAITLVFLTPEPSKDALPRKIISIASNKACFAIGDQNGNDAVLGTGSYKAGISAVGLSPKTEDDNGDVGTCMQRGFTAKPGLLRSFYVGQSDAHRVTARALQLREQAGIRQLEPAPVQEVDPLADLATVLAGRGLVPQDEALHLLSQRNHPAYGTWTSADLREALPDAARPYKTRGSMHVNEQRVAEALADRDADDDDHDDPESDTGSDGYDGE